jgi:hypothetical protein
MTDFKDEQQNVIPNTKESMWVHLESGYKRGMEQW